MNYAIGVDLGGTHVMAAVVDKDGRIGHRAERRLQSHDVDYVVGEINAAVREVLAATAGERIAGIGIGSPGNIDPHAGVIKYSPNFLWKDVPLLSLLAKHQKLPLHILNDARCATLGEYLHGSGRGTLEFALVTLGTGIGGGFISGGRLLLGHAMGAGEVGHHTIRPESGFVCGCGKIGCFEAQASGTGLVRHALALAPSFPHSELLPEERRDKWGPKMIRKAAEKGDPHALAAWDRFLEDLAIGISNIIAFTNPEVIALGGGVGTADASMLSRPLTKLVDERTTMVPKGITRIVSAKLGNDAGAVGAACLALRGGIRALLASVDGAATTPKKSAKR